MAYRFHKIITALVFPVTIFLSAFLLFFLEPLIAKMTVPWFGGSAAVWSTCLVFYQTALLLGYLYSRLLTRLRSLRLQASIHAVLLFASLFLLPIGPSIRWKPAASQDPTWAILAMLTATVGLPFLLLSTTSPLLQDWLVRDGETAPYRLFALSNFASLAALLSYPFLIEPTFDTHVQSASWSVAYIAFALLWGACAWSVGHRGSAHIQTRLPGEGTSGRAFSWRWLALSACGTMLLLSITNHISENIAAVPLLWVLPLAVYLLTFILAFNGERVYRRGSWLRFLAFALGLLAYGIHDVRSIENIVFSIGVFLFGLFACCFFCHGELYRLRPPAESLTTFYLVIAAGGAIGSIFVGIAAPRLFNGIYELPLTLAFTALLALLCVWPASHWSAKALWITIVCAMVTVFVVYRNAFGRNAIYMNRSFYGSLRVLQSPHAGQDETRTLFHGTIEHGAQFLLPPRRFQPTSYYGLDSGIGIVLSRTLPRSRRVGIIGLGVGTIAAYGRTGDVYRFYEINHQVVDVANSLFTYLRESKARIEIVEGDARLSLERDRSGRFDVLAIDAFSGDAIPVHLLTREAFALYRQHLNPEHGILAFHVSNRYLNLAPVVQQLASNAGYTSTLIRSKRDDDELIASADWVIVSKDPRLLDQGDAAEETFPIPSRAGRRPWTDDYNDLFEVLKMPQFH